MRGSSTGSRSSCGRGRAASSAGPAARHPSTPCAGPRPARCLVHPLALNQARRAADMPANGPLPPVPPRSDRRRPARRHLLRSSERAQRVERGFGARRGAGTAAARRGRDAADLKQQLEAAFTNDELESASFDGELSFSSQGERQHRDLRPRGPRPEGDAGRRHRRAARPRRARGEARRRLRHHGRQGLVHARRHRLRGAAGSVGQDRRGAREWHDWHGHGPTPS